jgi:hypothetical protein
MTDRHFPRPLAAFHGAVTCRRTAHALIVTGPAADAPDERLILTFVTRTLADLPDSLTVSDVLALDDRHYRIVSSARGWDIEATSLHVHRDVGTAFYRAIPPRPAPLKKRLFWRAVLALAGTRAGKRFLLSFRSR